MFVRGINSYQRTRLRAKALALPVDDSAIRACCVDVVIDRIPVAESRALAAAIKIVDACPLKLLFVANTVLQAVYAIGVVAAIYASVRDPAFARTAYSLLSGIVNGIGTFAFTLFVDPTAAGIVDSAVHGKRTVIEDVRAMVFWLTASRWCSER